MSGRPPDLRPRARWRRLAARVLGWARRAQSPTLVLIAEDGAVVKGKVETTAADDSIPGLGARSADDLPTARVGPWQLFQIVEDERMRIARDMHDGPAQLLSNLVLKAEIVARLVAEGSDRALAELADFQVTARQALEETRRLIFDLRPMSLDDLGLAATLRRFLCDVQERDEIRTGFSLAGDERRLPLQL